jgi:hypothetical protein
MYLLIMSTLLLGIATGVYVFFMTRADGGDTVVKEPTKGFEVLGYTYGACTNNGCSSYRIEHTGTYAYVPEVGAEKIEDTLSARQLSDLATAIEKASWDTYERAERSCADDEEMQYRFDVRKGSERYRLDSCDPGAQNMPLFTLLVNYFEIFTLTYDVE